MKHIIILLALVFSMASVTAQTTSPEEDYQTGKTYYEEGYYAQALIHFQKAALEGSHTEALYQLSRMYRLKKGVDLLRNTDEITLRMSTQAANQGHVKAQFELGYHYYHTNKPIRSNQKKAVYWYFKAADQGHALAQHNLGVMYENGKGVPQSDDQAIYWFIKASEQGVVKKNDSWFAYTTSRLYSPSYAF